MSLDVLARVYWDRCGYDGSHPYQLDEHDGDMPFVINRNHGSGDWWGAEFAVSNRPLLVVGLTRRTH